MSRWALIAFVGLAAQGLGCTPPPQAVGRTGSPNLRKDAVITAQDLTSVTIRKGKLETAHDSITTSHCGGECELMKRGQSSVVLTIAANGVAGVANQGESLEEFKSVAGGTGHKLQWQRSWQGSWTQKEDRMVLQLKPEATSCTRTAADGGSPESPCSDSPLALVCRSQRIRLDEPKNSRAQVWICRPKGKLVVRDGLTPFPWVFGIDRSIEMSDRSRGPRVKRFYLSDPLDEKKSKGS